MHPTTHSTARHRAGRGRRARQGPGRPVDALWTVAIGVPLGLVACGALVWQASYAAFTAQTGSAANAWTTGTVVLADDDTGQAMFTATNLAPSATVQGQRCITVTSSGSVPADVRMSAAVTGDATLAQNLDITVALSAVGGAGSFADCTGFTGTTVFTGTLAALGATHGSWATGVGQWTTATPASRTYRVTYTLNANAPSSVQSKTAGATFTWEARST